MTTPKADDAGPNRSSWLALPVVAFATLAVLFAVSLKGGDPSRLPSALIGKVAPRFAFAPVEGLGALEPATNGFSESMFMDTRSESNRVTVVNFWASWCAPCVEEHAQLVALKGRPGVVIAGVNVKDDPANARQFLNRYGNPFTMLGADRAGRGSIEWGVYGTPETFVVNSKGVITYKHVGPISAESLEKKLLPAIAAAAKN
jgi:cytochrome c biogenesis protein CcmG, thiol:disulfide interchange protein DsbE